MPPSDQLTPPQQEHLRLVLGWATDALAEGEQFLRSQFGYAQIHKTIKYIMGDYSTDTIPGSFSKMVDNRLGKTALDFTSALTDIKPFWDYHTYNKKYEQQATSGGKLTKHWWMSRLIDMKFADVIKYATVAGSGYGHEVYSEQLGDMDLIAEDPRDVLPIRPASNFSIQEAFGVIIRRERPTNYLRKRYPQYAHLIRPDRDMSLSNVAEQQNQTSFMAKLGMTSGFMQNLWASLGGRPAAHMNMPTTDVFTIYVDDDSRNESGRKVWMGEGTPDGKDAPNWSYWVEPGELMYPRKRAITFTRHCVLRDGPSIYWHGIFPLFKITIDPWPWSYLGKPPLIDCLGPQEELNKLMRGVSDHNQKVFRPDLVADKNALSRAAMSAIDTRRAGLKLRHNPIAGKPPALQYADPLDPSIRESITDLRDMISQLSGVHDMTQLMSLNQIPTTETIDKIIESMSPAIRARSRVLEASLREFAMMTLSNIFQFYTLPMRIATLGSEGMTFEDFDFDPGNMIPEFINMDDEAAGMHRPKAERARQFLRYFTYDITPGSLLSASEMTQKLMYVQLFRSGMMDIWTLADKLGIPNYGNPPEGATTVTQRLAAMQAMGLTPAVSSTGRKASGEQPPKMSGSGQITESKS